MSRSDTDSPLGDRRPPSTPKEQQLDFLALSRNELEGVRESFLNKLKTPVFSEIACGNPTIYLSVQALFTKVS